MAEILVNLEDITQPNDPILDSKSYKRGDVIEVQDDGWEWGEGELGPQFAIVVVAGATKADLEYLKEAEQGDPKVQPLLQRCAVKFDIDTFLSVEAPTGRGVLQASPLGAAIEASIPIGNRGGLQTTTAAIQDFALIDALALVSVKPPLNDAEISVAAIPAAP